MSQRSVELQEIDLKIQDKRLNRTSSKLGKSIKEVMDGKEKEKEKEKEDAKSQKKGDKKVKIRL